jgi:hypothetical protein
MATIGNTRVVTHADGSVRIHVTPEVMFNFDKSTALLSAVLGRCGCPTCHSGLPIAFIVEEAESAA